MPCATWEICMVLRWLIFSCVWPCPKWEGIPESPVLCMRKKMKKKKKNQIRETSIEKVNFFFKCQFRTCCIKNSKKLEERFAEGTALWPQANKIFELECIQSYYCLVLLNFLSNTCKAEIPKLEKGSFVHLHQMQVAFLLLFCFLTSVGL